MLVKLMMCIVVFEVDGFLCSGGVPGLGGCDADNKDSR